MKLSISCHLRSLIPSAVLILSPLAAHAAPPVAPQPVTLLHTTYLPDVVGDFDHFAVDLKRNHLFVAAEEHHSVEMFDLRTGEHLQSLSGFKTPHTLAFDEKKDELMVCDGGDSALILVNPTDFHRLDRVQLIDGSATGKGDSPDAGYFDTETRLLYIGNGGVSANLPNSKISIFSPDAGKLVGEIDIPGGNVESMVVDDAHHRLYVNIRDKQKIGVVDLSAGKIVDTWTVDGMNKNTSMSMDKKNGRLFVAGRNPNTFYAFDVKTGKVVAQLPCVNTNDDQTFDPLTKRIYVAGLGGLSVFHEDTPDHYSELLNLPTNGGKTSIYVPALHQLYIAHPKTNVDIAALLVYHVNP